VTNNVPEGTRKESMTALEDALENITGRESGLIVLGAGENPAGPDDAPDPMTIIIADVEDEENESALILSTAIAGGVASVTISAFCDGELVEPTVLAGLDGSILITHAI
jgi:hypothetical protein